MKIKFLGTAAAEATPAVFCECDVCRRARETGGRNIRTRSQSIINDDLFIDFPSDAYFHIIKENINPAKIHTLILTHAHEDHFYPNDIKMRGYPWTLQDKLQTMHIYGNNKVCAAFPRDEETQNKLSVKVTEIKPFEPFTTEKGEYRITALRALHDPNQLCFIYMIEQNGKRILYGNDTGFFPEDTMDYIKDIMFDEISLDCTSGANTDGKYHMGIEDMLEMHNRLRQNGNISDETILVAHHFSHGGKYTYDDYVKHLSQYGIITSYDGLEIEV